LQYLYLSNTSVGYATLGSYLRDMTGLRISQIQDCSLTEAEVDNILEDLYQGRAGFTYATPTANVSGTNAAPSGTYQDATPPTTGKEFEYKIEVDPDSEGFNKWVVTTS